LFGFSIEKRVIPLSLTTSVIIPCHYKHAQYLPALLQSLADQSEVPSEVIISLSESNRVSENIMETLALSSYPFYLLVIPFVEAVSEGRNRNCACAYAKGDVFICQDADDLPHPDRIKVIKYFFETYHVDHLIHSYIIDRDKKRLPVVENFDDIRSFHTSDYKNLNKIGSACWANGPIAIRREVFDAIHWEEAFSPGCDVVFNKLVYSRFPGTVLLDISLYIYRNRLSSYK